MSFRENNTKLTDATTTAVHPNVSANLTVDIKQSPRPKSRRILTEEQRPGNFSDWKWLTKLGPGFGANGSQLRVVGTPEEYYSILLDKCSTAKRRISIASLYLGTCELEKRMVDALKQNMIDNPKLKVKILLDYARGSRGDINSRTMLAPLTQTSGQPCEVFLYHTPALRGKVKKWLPPRYNEIVGVQHMKIYVFDDSILISGANLSNDYFTNRQDRYLLIEECEKLANFYDGLIDQVSKFSFKLDDSNKVSLHPNWSIHPSDGDASKFVREARNVVVSYYEDNRRTNERNLGNIFQSSPENTDEGNLSEDTWVFPLIQMGPLGINYDNEGTSTIFEQALPGSVIKLATGYFNLTSDYIEKIIKKSRCDYEILMAHPKANGFFGAKGFAGGIPAAYTQLAKIFFQNVKTAQQENRISMWEYLRPGWTFHSKGLWYYPAGGKLPVATLIGSPNFGHRSMYVDLETQVYITTRNRNLQVQLDNEQRNLFSHSHSFGNAVIQRKDRAVPKWVKLTIRLFRKYF